MKITVDQSKCIGCGACVSLCHKVFELNECGKSYVRVPDKALPKLCKECDCEQAARNCPVEAITIKK